MTNLNNVPLFQLSSHVWIIYVLITTIVIAIILYLIYYWISKKNKEKEEGEGRDDTGLMIVDGVVVAADENSWPVSAPTRFDQPVFSCPDGLKARNPILSDKPESVSPSLKPESIPKGNTEKLNPFLDNPSSLNSSSELENHDSANAGDRFVGGFNPFLTNPVPK